MTEIVHPSYLWMTAWWVNFFLYNTNNLTLKLCENNVGGQTTKEPHPCGKYRHLLVALCNWQIPSLVQEVCQKGKKELWEMNKSIKKNT